MWLKTSKKIRAERSEMSPVWMHMQKYKININQCRNKTIKGG